MASAPLIFRYRVRFCKLGALRYVGHLDLQRAFERTLRRARMPVVLTEGFNARVRMQFAQPLPLGFTSSAELVDIWLHRCVPPAELLEALAATEPPGMTMLAAWAVARVHKVALPTVTLSADYRVPLADPPADIAARVGDLLGRERVERERRGKPYDLRELLEALRFVVDEGGARLQMQLATREAATGRPEEVLDELGLDPLSLRIHRDALLLSGDAAREERHAARRADGQDGAGIAA